MSIADQIQQLKEELPPSVTLVAVTKTHPIEVLQETYAAGLRDFGENRVQELIGKQPLLPADIRWHAIGTLQTNKVKYIAPFVHLIHSVDSKKLLLEINRQALKNNRSIPCLLQVHIAQEETKFGLNEEELFALLNDPDVKKCTAVSIEGLMGMATFTEDEDAVRKEFQFLKGLFDRVQEQHGRWLNRFTRLSMGMSGDYRVAVEEGSTLVRIGSLIFGER